MVKRIVFDFLLLIFIFIFPWWFNLIAIIFGILFFDDFYEFIFFSLAFYSMFFIPSSFWFSKIIFPIIIMLAYFTIQFIKNNLFLYKK